MNPIVKNFTITFSATILKLKQYMRIEILFLSTEKLYTYTYFDPLRAFSPRNFDLY